MPSINAPSAIPDLEYALDLPANKLLPSVKVSTFFFKTGRSVHNLPQQRQCISLGCNPIPRCLRRHKWPSARRII
jgi:hypothetical protein